MSELRFDYTNVLESAVGAHGLTTDELFGMAEQSAVALRAVEARRAADLRWLDLPYQEETCARIVEFAEGARSRFRNVALALLAYIALFAMVSVLRTFIEQERLGAMPGLWLAYVIQAMLLVYLVRQPRFKRR